MMLQYMRLKKGQSRNKVSSFTNDAFSIIVIHLFNPQP